MIGVLIGLLFCHYLGDFTHLSRPYMLKAKAVGKPLRPILDHAAIHAVLMGALVWIMCGPGPAVLVFIIELVTHFLIDVLKGRLNVWYPKLANPATPWHWYVFGVDQLLHILVIILITVIVS